MRASDENWQTAIDTLAEAQAEDARRRTLHCAYRAGAIAVMQARGFSEVARTHNTRLDMGFIPWLSQDTQTHYQSRPITLPVAPEDQREFVVGSVTAAHRYGPLGMRRPEHEHSSQEFYIRDVSSGPDLHPTFERRGYRFGPGLRDEARLPHCGAGLAQEWHHAEVFAEQLASLAEVLNIALPQRFAEFAGELEP